MANITAKEAFEAGNYALVRQIANPNKLEEAALLKRIQTDQKVIWAGIFGVFVVLLATLITLH